MVVIRNVIVLTTRKCAVLCAKYCRTHSKLKDVVTKLECYPDNRNYLIQMIPIISGVTLQPSLLDSGNSICGVLTKVKKWFVSEEFELFWAY